MNASPPPEVRDQYIALTQRAGWFSLAGRTQVEVTGADRASLLNGLCTNDIRRLTPESGCEAFLTNAQGKTIGYAYVFCLDESLILETVAGQAEAIIQGLDRYVIREDVVLSDRSETWAEVAVCGNEAAEKIRKTLALSTPTEPLAHCSGGLAGEVISVRRVPYGGGNCFFVSCGATLLPTLIKALQLEGAVEAGAAAAEILRLEAGTPLFGIDVTEQNLPQEIDRNQQAISFTKGCYLGQETVARLDALGHVNRRLRGLLFSGTEMPAVGTRILRDGKVTANLTSTAWSYRCSAPLALAFVRRGLDQAGTPLQTEFGEAEVIDLPLTQ